MEKTELNRRSPLRALEQSLAGGLGTGNIGVVVPRTCIGKTAFLVELHYAGVFVVSGFSEENHQKALMIECPRLLFPFARRVIADMVRDGGFPQLMLGTIDFVQLYETYLQQNQAEADARPADA